MDVVSYRGPGVAGGVSSGLGTAWRHAANSKSKWWFLNKGVLEYLSADSNKNQFVALLPESLVEGHYGYCNEFLWPLMHDLPQYASYSKEQHEHYRTFNRLVAESIDVESISRQEYFIQDYQLGLSPRWLSMYGHKTVLFWHIPWPKNVPEEYVEPIAELALGLLGANALGFHTEEYAENFMNFVAHHVAGLEVDTATMTVSQTEHQTARVSRSFASAPHKSYVMQQHHARPRHLHSTKVLVQALGVDFEFWTGLRDENNAVEQKPELLAIANKGKFVLSVDRVDYTKAVFDRLQIIDKFFEHHPEWVGNLSFVQICGRSRPGLPAFDQYWDKCNTLLEAVNNKWRKDSWEPINWVKQSLSSQELAYLYANAQTMLVNPVRDGLNLTAKEYVACQGSKPGVLLLSPGAGAIHELGDYSLPASPEDHEGTVESLANSLVMPLRERQIRTLKMKTVLVGNQLSHWWTNFNRLVRTPDMHLVHEDEREVKQA